MTWVRPLRRGHPRDFLLNLSTRVRGSGGLVSHMKRPKTKGTFVRDPCTYDTNYFRNRRNSQTPKLWLRSTTEGGAKSKKTKKRRYCITFSNTPHVLHPHPLPQTDVNQHTCWSFLARVQGLACISSNTTLTRRVKAELDCTTVVQTEVLHDGKRRT